MRWLPASACAGAPTRQPSRASELVCFPGENQLWADSRSYTSLLSGSAASDPPPVGGVGFLDLTFCPFNAQTTGEIESTAGLADSRAIDV